MPPSDDLTGCVTSGNSILFIHDTTCDLLESSIIDLTGLKLEGDATEFKVTNGILDHKLRSTLSFNEKPRKKLSLLLDRQLLAIDFCRGTNIFEIINVISMLYIPKLDCFVNHSHSNKLIQSLSTEFILLFCIVARLTWCLQQQKLPY